MIRAIAAAADMTWDAVYWELAQKGYELAEMPSWNTVWWEYLKDKGFERHYMADRCPDCYTVEDFCKDHPEGSYILYIPYTSHEGNAGHAVAVKSGFYVDTWDSGSEIPMCYWKG